MAMNAQGLASLGRMGDNSISHTTTGEQVLPVPVKEDPAVKKIVEQAFAKHGIDPERYTVGHSSNSINPQTGLPEFGFSFKKLGKSFRKIAQPVLTAIGFAVAGPAGAAAGSAIGGGVRRGNFDLKDAVKDAVGGYVVGSVAVGAGMTPGTYNTSATFGANLRQGVASLNPFAAESVYGFGATPAAADATGIGAFFQNVGARGASMLPGGGTVEGTQAANLFGKEGAYQSLGMLDKVGVGAVGMLAADKMGLMEQAQMQGPGSNALLDPASEQYLTQPLRGATIPTAGIPQQYQMGNYANLGGVGGLQNNDQQIVDMLEEQRRKYQMQYPTFANEGGPIKGYQDSGQVDSRGAPIDNIPAMLTEDEHVLTADAVQGLGGGDIEKGHMIAKQLNNEGEELQQKLTEQVLNRKYFMQFPSFNTGAA
jgi:hypothetical protein